MNDAIKAVADTINAPCPKQCDHDAAAYGKACTECTHTAERIYTAHVKPLEDALAKAEADKAALVEALEGMCRLYDSDDGTRSAPEYQQASDALANVKGGAA